MILRDITDFYEPKRMKVIYGDNSMEVLINLLDWLRNNEDEVITVHATYYINGDKDNNQPDALYAIFEPDEE